MYLILSGFVAVFLYGIYRRLRAYFRGSSTPVLRDLSVRVRRALVEAFGQRKVARKTYPGLMHLLIYSGIIVLFIGTTLVFIDTDLWQTLFGKQILVGEFYLFYELFLDAFGILAILGILAAVLRRTASRPPNLPSARDDVYILSILLTILVTGYVMEGIRLAVDRPDWAPWSFIGFRFATFFEVQGFTHIQLTDTYRWLWWFHAILAFTAVASIPYTKLFHIFTSPLNALSMHIRPKGQLSAPFDLRQLLASGNFDVKVGAAQITDFSWQQRLSFDSCTSCGRCTNACPATAGGTLLSPMHLILKLRNAMFSKQFADGGAVLLDGLVDPEELWACTTCRACVKECPVLIDHVDAIVEMRRQLVAEMKIDRDKKNLLTNLNSLSNPYGLSQSDRLKWAEGLDVRTVKDQPDFEVLYWVGCAGSYDPRNQKVSQAVAKILNAAGVRFSVLGTEEKCNCEAARRLGEEGRFQQAALELIELFNRYGVKTIITQCPHCFNTFRNEYPEFGAKFTVLHHSQLIAQLIQTRRLRLKQASEKTVTFHDPCYLGRYNDEYEASRNVLNSLGNVALKEMPRCKKDSFCCGAGGANFWYKVDQKRKVNVIRFQEAQNLRPEILATACPFCTSMFEDASTGLDAKQSLSVRDIAEIVADLIEPA